ncbi:MAG: hypothetical protein AB1696_24235 [Planctomycetota bacterium]
MGWIVFDARLHEDDFLLSAGKSLFLCQHFEWTCKEIVMWLSLSKALYKKQFEFLSAEHRDYVDQLLSLFLGQSIQRLNQEFGGKINEHDIDLVKGAKDSRNFICHECMLNLVYAPLGDGYSFDWDTDSHRKHIRHLAEGDYVVSRWTYEFHEKESGAFKNRDCYVTAVESWVFNNKA